MKTAKELGLKQEAYDALLLVRDGLIDGIINERFNMNYWEHSHYKSRRGNCGTAVCIGGWMSTILAREDESLLSLVTQDLSGTGFYDYENYLLEREDDSNEEELRCEANLYRLFYPSTDNLESSGIVCYDALTPEDAIKSITSYLETGKSSWPAANWQPVYEGNEELT